MKDTGKRPTLWFDKDGVLGRYDYDIYLPETGCTPPWLTKNAHVYRYIPANKQMMKAFRMLYAHTLDNPPHERRYDVKTLTAVSDSVTLSEQVIDSWKWMKGKVKGFKEGDFYAIATSKQDIPVILRGEITPMDVLIDDYNKNLAAWKKKGGTAVKALNGINSRNDAFLNVDIRQNHKDTARFFENLAACLSSRGPVADTDLRMVEEMCAGKESNIQEGEGSWQRQKKS